MGAELTLIRTAYEVEGLSPEQIAESQDLDLVAVKAGLMNCSVQYRKDCGAETEGAHDRYNFSDDDLARVNEVILDLALGAEDEHLRGKMACYVRDDKKGRKEVAALMKGNNFNILMINEKLKEVRRIKDNIINVPQTA